MSKREVLCTRYGEMRDLITCYQIENGELLPVDHRKTDSHEKVWTYDEAIALE